MNETIVDCRIPISDLRAMDQQDLIRRKRDFAIMVMKLVDALPHSAEGRAIANQLVRSGTAVGANYRAYRRSRSKAECIARLRVVEEEANELVAIRAAARKSAALTINRKSAIANRK